MTFCDSHNDILICGLAASGSLSQTLQPSQVFNAATTLSPTCGVWRTPHTLAPSKRLLPFGFRPRGHAKLPSPGSSASDPGQLRWWGAPPGLSRRPQASVTSPSNTLWERRLSRSPKSVEADLQRLKSVPAPPPVCCPCRGERFSGVSEGQSAISSKPTRTHGHTSAPTQMHTHIHFLINCNGSFPV